MATTGIRCASNMPAISVRDIEVKDDASCMCSDLVAGTHGRGFWILDDVTPLRQAAEAAAGIQRVSVQAGDRHPHPLRHQRSYAVAAGTAGGRKSAARRAGRLLPARRRRRRSEAGDSSTAQGKVIRTYSSNDPVREPDPATDPVAYNKLCQQTPTAPDCSLAAVLARAAAGPEDQRRHASLQLGHALRSDSRRRRRRTRRRRRRTARFRIAPTPASIRPGSRRARTPCG